MENLAHHTVMSNMEPNVLQQLVSSVMHNIFGCWMFWLNIGGTVLIW